MRIMLEIVVTNQSISIIDTDTQVSLEPRQLVSLATNLCSIPRAIGKRMEADDVINMSLQNIAALTGRLV